MAAMPDGQCMFWSTWRRERWRGCKGEGIFLFCYMGNTEGKMALNGNDSSCRCSTKEEYMECDLDISGIWKITFLYIALQLTSLYVNAISWAFDLSFTRSKAKAGFKTFAEEFSLKNLWFKFINHSLKNEHGQIHKSLICTALVSEGKPIYKSIYKCFRGYMLHFATYHACVRVFKGWALLFKDIILMYA